MLLSQTSLLYQSAIQLYNRWMINTTLELGIKWKMNQGFRIDRYKEENGILYHINNGNGKKYQAVVVPKILTSLILKEMHHTFGHLAIRKNIHITLLVKKSIHIKIHVLCCYLCRHKKLVADEYRWVPLKPDFLGAWKSVWLKHYLAYPIIIISLIRQRNLAEKIRAKWESGLTAVRLKWDPPVLV